jgi:hypothetical protein
MCWNAADALWAELDAANSALADALEQLSALHAADARAYDAVVEELATLPAAKVITVACADVNLR